MSYVISGTESGAVVFPVATFESAVRERWNGSVESVGVAASDGMLVADIQSKGEPGFSIRIKRNGEVMSTDGTRDQVADVAVWAVSLLPSTTRAEVVLYDANGQRVLHRGMSTADVWSDWRDF